MALDHVPGAQLAHAAGALKKVPAGQEAAVAAVKSQEIAPATLAVPAAQGTQEDEPLAKVPAGQEAAV